VRLRFDGDARAAARAIVSGVEGAMLVARSYGDPRRFQDAADRLLAGLAVD
jgi:TetR/AcrR family transcriptional regulator, transcriptional repressor for nem operon